MHPLPTILVWEDPIYREDGKAQSAEYEQDPDRVVKGPPETTGDRLWIQLFEELLLDLFPTWHRTPRA